MRDTDTPHTHVPRRQTAAGLNPAAVLRIILLAAACVLINNVRAEAYIGPGAGFAALGSFLVMFAAMLSAVVTIFTWPIRYLIRAIRGWRAYTRSRVRRCVILGLDGLEPTLAEKFMAEGKMPNLARLREQGGYKRLGTSLPALSPVAWSCFLTGCNPGKHAIFDFLTRDRRNYLPLLSSVSIRPPRRCLRVGHYEIPLSKPDVRLLRKGVPFWTILGRHGIFSNIIRVPITWPPEKHRGLLLSAMCVPDLRGSQGTFSFYTTKSGGNGEYIGGEQFRVTRQGDRIDAELIGPANPLHKEHREMRCPFRVTLNGRAGTAVLDVGGRRYPLKQGTYSPWVEVVFKAGLGMKVRGICQFLLLSADPELTLYVTPINIDPVKPAMPISNPQIYSVYLAKRLGRYATLGLAEDTWALNAKILSDEHYLQQCRQADQEREAMFFDALDKVKRGLVVCVFDGPDRIQHMFWRYLDDQHPAHGGQADPQHQRRRAVEEMYQRMDELVGRTMAKCRDEYAGTVLMVISDHGFKSFRCGVDLNRWLLENGYLQLKADVPKNKYLSQVDWSRTRAYALGLAGIYLNVRGREAQGIVEPGRAADQLREELAAKLTGLIDPGAGRQAIKRAYIAAQVYKGPYKGEAPDLIVGYWEGYRVAWQTAVGEMTDRVFHENKKAWGGDHCIDPSEVPGVLFCNRRIEAEQPRLIDLGPTVLDLFGVPVPRHIDGQVLTLGEAGEITAQDGG